MRWLSSSLLSTLYVVTNARKKARSFFASNVQSERAFMIKIVQGSVLDAVEEYVLQQCDCISTQVKDLDADYKREFPWADVYGERTPMKGWRNLATVDTRGKPGDIKVFPSGNDEPNVVALFCQMCPGKPFTGINHKKRFKDDTYENRLKWFEECLKKVAELKPKSLALPHNLGCSGSGGDWNDYSDKIQEFCDDNPDCHIIIYATVA